MKGLIIEAKVHEDSGLGKWFNKEDPPGKQKGWVNVCEKKPGGGHPPCGRSDADKGKYPLCRSHQEAQKMTAEEKRKACKEKREKQKGQKGKKPKRIDVKKHYEDKDKKKKDKSKSDDACWEGYERVPGTEKYEPGSCRKANLISHIHTFMKIAHAR